MKTAKTILITVFFLSTLNIGATILTCSNNTNSPGQYTGLQAAISASSTSVMDTILVSGSATNYSAVTVDHKVCIIGTGFNPQKQLPLTSKIVQLTFADANASGSVLIGLVFVVNNPSINSSVANVRDIKILRCKTDFPIEIQATGNNGWTIEGCVINNSNTGGNKNAISASDADSMLIRNNIITVSGQVGTGESSYRYAVHASSTTAASFIITNNVFIGSDNGPSSTYTNALGYSTGYMSSYYIQNNIFWRCSSKPPYLSMIQPVLNNNISFGGLEDWFINGSNNISGTDPLFENVPGSAGVAGVISSWSPGYDFRLRVTSAGHNSGLDGTDRGTFGGAGIFLQSGEPGIPQISLFNITSPTTIPPGQSIDINVISKSHQ